MPQNPLLHAAACQKRASDRLAGSADAVMHSRPIVLILLLRRLENPTSDQLVSFLKLT